MRPVAGLSCWDTRRRLLRGYIVHLMAAGSSIGRYAGLRQDRGDYAALFPQ